MMRAVLMFIPMSIVAALALDVAMPALVLLVCIVAGRAVTSVGAWGARGTAFFGRRPGIRGNRT